jgi:hypothetical protein
VDEEVCQKLRRRSVAPAIPSHSHANPTHTPPPALSHLRGAILLRLSSTTGDDDNNGPMFRGFSQRSGESTPRDAGLKLRHQAISFVSAGNSTPIEKKQGFLEEADIVAALVEEEDDDGDNDLEDEATEDTLVDDLASSALDNTLVTDTDVEITRDTKAMHIHEHVGAPIATLDGAMDTLPDTVVASSSKPPTPPQEEILSFVIDTEGDPSLSRPRHSNARVPVRPSSPTPSDSSEEVILFHGRNKPKVVDDPVTSSRNTPARHQPPKVPKHQKPVQQAPSKVPTPQPQVSEAHMTDDLLEALGQSVSQGRDASGWAAKAPKWNQQVQTAPAEFTPAPPGSWWKTKGMPRPDLGPSPEDKMALDAALPRASKVAFANNMEEDNVASAKIATAKAEWDQALREKKRNKQTAQELDDGFETVDEDEPSSSAAPKVVNRAVAHDLGAKTNRRGKRGRKRSNKLLRDLQSDQTDEDEAAYNDYMENLKAQLEADDDVGITGIRSAEGGPSLVVDGQAIDENDVLDRSTQDLNFDELRMMDTESDSDDEELGLDIDDLEDDDDDDASEFDSSDLESELAYNEKEQWEDEEDLRERRIAAMDDETLARLWAKQAELGISDDDLVIDDGKFVGEDLDEFGDVDQAKAGLESLANSSFGRSTTKRSTKKRGGMTFPSASALADTLDQYGDAGFDIMDFERPSLRPKRGGRKGKIPPELEALSDDELKDEVLGQWSNDREKKRIKKAEREELRREGLLGAGVAKKGKADLSQKYVQGMTVTQIHDEIRVFLQDVTKTTRAFPPMDKHDRKSLHEIASVLNLKSKSVGAGKNRAPILYKTNRTAEYTDATFHRITAAANKGFLKNSAFKGKKPKGGAVPKMQRGGKGRGADTSSTGLKHGDVVGGGAKEIGRENFGHRLMEKMGWQTGTALGKDGSGMLTPVEQIMRTGRSGLG